MSQHISQTPAVPTRVRAIGGGDIVALLGDQSLRVARPHNGSTWFEPGTLTIGTGSTGPVFTSDFGPSHRLRGVLAADETEPQSGDEVIDVLVIDPDGDQEIPMVPVFGALATLSVILQDVDPDEAMTRLTRALEAEFGADATRVLRSKTRATPDIRVDVTRTDADGAERVHAVGVLADEASYLVPMPHTVVLHNPERAENVIVGR